MFTDTFIKKPVYAIVLSIFILTIGLIGLQKLPVRQYPEVTPSVISVETVYPGASAKDIELFVTKPLEEALASVDKLDYITSDSVIGKSSITLNFKLGADVNKALSDVYTNVAVARGDLPTTIREPIIKKIDPNKSPLLYLGLLGDKNWQNADLEDYFATAIKPSLQNIAGVGMIQVFGNYKYGMHMQLDPIKLAAINTTQAQVSQAIGNESFYPGISSLESKAIDYPLSFSGQANTKALFDNIPVKKIAQQVVNLAQVAKVEMRPPKTNVRSSVQGKPAVFLGIIPTSDANPLDLSAEIKQLLDNFKAIVPAGFKIKVFWDAAVFIKQSLAEVKWAIAETTIAVLLILVLFLGSFRLALVPAVTIPLSIIGVFVLMSILGFSINTFTLLAMVLAIGMVVDDAIVVLENIFRHVECGLSPRDAAIKGAREIYHPVIVMTLTLAAVFAPVGFIDGLTGTLFREFAFTLAGAVIISGVVALTLSPVMCERVLQGNSQETRLAKLVDKYFKLLTNGYLSLLKKVLPKKKTIFSLIVAMSAITAAGLVFLPNALVPQEDSGVLMSFISGPAGANLNYMSRYTKDFDSKVGKMPEVKETALVNGFMGDNTAMSIGILRPWHERTKTAAQLAQDLQKSTSEISGIKAFVINPFIVPGASRTMPLGFVVRTLGSLKDLDYNMQKLINSIRDKNSPFYEWRIFFPNTEFSVDTPTYNLELNSKRIFDAGISNKQLGQELVLALTDREGGSYAINNNNRDWYAELADSYKHDFAALGSANIMLPNNTFTPISSFFNLKQTVQPGKISHFQQLRSATFAAAALMPGYTMGQALAHIKKAAISIFPKGTLFDYVSQSRTLIETQGHTFALYAYAILFIYLVMAVQYESFIDPLIILLCVPLAGLGALLLLFLTNGSINMYTNIGMVTLIGLITKHGILLVDFANRALVQGMSRSQAVMAAAAARLRPIILTTAAMILAAVPLVFASGAGNIARNQMGLTILGGMAIGTILSLFIIPTVFTHIKK